MCRHTWLSIWFCINDLTDVPSSPGQPKADVMKKDSCRITWSPPENDNGAHVTGYIIERYELSSGKWVKVSEEKVSFFFCFCFCFCLFVCLFFFVLFVFFLLKAIAKLILMEYLVMLTTFFMYYFTLKYSLKYSLKHSQKENFARVNVHCLTNNMSTCKFIYVWC